MVALVGSSCSALGLDEEWVAKHNLLPVDTEWITQGNAAVETVGSEVVEGATSVSVTASEADPVYVDDTRTVRVATAPPVEVQSGHAYGGRVKVLTETEGVPVRCELRFYEPGGRIVGTLPGPQVLTEADEWVSPVCLAQPPEGSGTVALRVHVADMDYGDDLLLDDAALIDLTDSLGDEESGEVVVPVTLGPPMPPQTTSTAPTTSAPPGQTPSSTSTPPSTSVPAEDQPTEANTGPQVPNPTNVGRVRVRSGEEVKLDDVVVDHLFVEGGGRLVANNVRVLGSLNIESRLGKGTTSARLTNVAVHNGMTVRVHDQNGTLYWGSHVPIDLVMRDSWVYHPRGSGAQHTEAMDAHGLSEGGTFLNTAFVQQGPHNNTATATMTWHGTDVLFDGCHFLWEDGTAAYYTVYVDGPGNVVRNSRMERGLSNYVYPDSPEPARYESNQDAITGKPITVG